MSLLMQHHVISGFKPSWDINTLVNESEESFTEFTQSTGIYWSKDGLNFFVSNGTDSEIYKYTTTKPFDLVSLVYDSVILLSGNIQGITFKPDGLKMFTIEYGSNGVIREYNLSTAWNLSTATLSFSKSTISTATGLYFNSDGTKLFSCHRYQKIYSYNLSIAWDLSTVTSVTNITLSNGENYLTGLFFKPDGSRLYVISFSNSRIYQFDLSSNWDLTTLIYDSHILISSLGVVNTFNDVLITGDGRYLFGGQTNIISKNTMVL